MRTMKSCCFFFIINLILFNNYQDINESFVNIYKDIEESLKKLKC